MMVQARGCGLLVQAGLGHWLDMSALRSKPASTEPDVSLEMRVLLDSDNEGKNRRRKSSLLDLFN